MDDWAVTEAGDLVTRRVGLVAEVLDHARAEITDAWRWSGRPERLYVGTSAFEEIRRCRSELGGTRQGSSEPNVLGLEVAVAEDLHGSEVRVH